jgi:hypothetical protein
VKAQTQTIGNDHERTDALATPLVQFLIGLTIMCALSFWGMRVLLVWSQRQETVVQGNARHPLAQDRTVPSEPRLEGTRDSWGRPLGVHAENFTDASKYFSSQNVAELRAHERERLSTYGWVDKQNQIVHIPIDAAIQLTLKRGLPVSK